MFFCEPRSGGIITPPKCHRYAVYNPKTPLRATRMSLLRSFFDFLDYLAMSIILKNATSVQAPVLIDFLQKVNLPCSDLPTDLSGFTLAFDGGNLASEIAQTDQFSALCPSSAVVMKITLE